MTLRLYTDLSSGSTEDGHWFEALRIGTFRDMHGKGVSFTSEDLDRLVDETQKVIDASRDTEGEILGLPIDQQNHDHGHAAGWIVGIKRAGDKILLLPKWTELGVDLIKKKIMKLFSATVDVGRMALKGGSLTNWPAVTGLKPIELSEQLVSFTLPDEPLYEAEERIRKQFYTQFPLPDWLNEPMGSPVPVSAPTFCKGVYDNYIIAEQDGQLYRVEMTPGEHGVVTFAGRDSWQAVRMVPTELTETPTENTDMLTDEMKDEIKGAVADSLKAVLPDLLKVSVTAPDGTQTSADFAAYSEQLLAQQKAEFQKEFERIEAEKSKAFAEFQAKMRAEMALREFCSSVTDGSAGHALPITAIELSTVLNKIDTAVRKDVQDILAKIVKVGLVEMSANGTDGNGGAEHKAELPAHVAAALRAKKLTVADLSSEMMAGELELPLNRYDLSEFTK